MNKEQIKTLYANDLARMLGVSYPDSDTSPGSQFLYSVRDSYLSEHEEIAEAEYPDDDIAERAGPVPDNTYQQWLTFGDLTLWSLDSDEAGVFTTIEWDKLSEVIEMVLGETAERLYRLLWQEDDINPERASL